MRKIVIVLLMIMLLTSACALPFWDDSQGGNSENQPKIPSEPDDFLSQDVMSEWPQVTGPDPSPRVAAFYYPWYYNMDVDGHWDHWGEGGLFPPVKISSDYYPVLGAYSESDPMVLAQHFAWLRQAGVGLIVSSWWGQGGPADKALPLMLDVADHYGIKIAFHIEPYGGRTASSLKSDIRYIYLSYGDHPAFYWTTDTSLYSIDDRPKGLFFIWATVVPDGESGPVSTGYWQASMDEIHARNPGAIVITDQNDPAWVTDSHFDGSYNYGVLDADQVGYKWAANLPTGAWFIPGINPGFSARRIGYEAWVDTPRQDGATYDDRWEQMFAVGIEPALVAITTFNEWHEGTQIEPAVSSENAPEGVNYLDYESLPPEGYLEKTREWADVFLAYQWMETESYQIKVITSSDWTELHLVSGATWQGPLLLSASEDVVNAVMSEGYFSLTQPLNLAESGNRVEAVFTIGLKAGGSGDPVVFEIERGGLGTTWVEIYQQEGEGWVMVTSFKWAGYSGGRNAESFTVAGETIFGAAP